MREDATASPARPFSPVGNLRRAFYANERGKPPNRTGPRTQSRAEQSRANRGRAGGRGQRKACKADGAWEQRSNHLSVCV